MTTAIKVRLCRNRRHEMTDENTIRETTRGRDGEPITSLRCKACRGKSIGHNAEAERERRVTELAAMFERFRPAWGWQLRAKCRDQYSDAFFPESCRSAEAQRTKLICADCPVRTECLVDALAMQEHGIRGGYVFPGEIMHVDVDALIDTPLIQNMMIEEISS